MASGHSLDSDPTCDCNWVKRSRDISSLLSLSAVGPEEVELLPEVPGTFPYRVNEWLPIQYLDVRAFGLEDL